MRTAVALAVGVVAAIAFLDVTEDVLEGDATPFDHATSLWLHGLDSPALGFRAEVLGFGSRFHGPGALRRRR